MYEIVCVIAGKEVVVETVDNIVTASNYTSFHRTNGIQAFYRAVLRKAA